MSGFFELRTRRGDDHPFSKLSPGQRKELRLAYGPGVTMKELADRLKVSPSTVRRFLRHESYCDDD